MKRLWRIYKANRLLYSVIQSLINTWHNWMIIMQDRDHDA